jgi:hypothetical protein
MPDIVRIIEGVPVKFIDNEDGSYSVSSTGSGGGGSVDVTTLATHAKQDEQTAKLTDIVAQTLNLTKKTDIQGVQVQARVCTGTQMITALSAATAASLTIPANSVVAVIQADGGVVRLRQDAAAPTATRGMRIDDGAMYTADSVLADVRLLAQSGTTTNVQVTYFDRV